MAGGRGQNNRKRYDCSISLVLGRNKGAQLRTNVNLPRLVDLPVVVVECLHPMGNPAGKFSDREENREYVSWDIQRMIDNSRVKIFVRIELPFDEVIIGEGVFLKLFRNVDLWKE